MRKPIWQLFAVLALCVATTGNLASADDRQETLQVSITKNAIVVSGVEPDQLAKFASSKDSQAQWFTVRLVQKDMYALPAMLGAFNIHENTVTFAPKFPFSKSGTYQVALAKEWLGDGAATRELAIETPSLPAETAKVVHVFPTTNRLAENLLKFYIHFSTPMNRGEAYRRIHLMHGGREVESPFLELGEELWNQDQTRFTLFIHPGRLKHGVLPREEDGLPLNEGGEYSLVIDSQWASANGASLKSAFVKDFSVIGSDDQRILPAEWKLETPAAGSYEPVSLSFGEPLDSALLERVLTIQDHGGKRVKGLVLLAEYEQGWSFVPEVPWSHAGSYRILIQTDLEDLCGNSIARSFETKFKPATGKSPTQDAVSDKFIAVEFFPQ